MNQELLRQFDEIPYPVHDSKALADEVREFEVWHSGMTQDLTQAQALPRRAKESLSRHFNIDAAGVPLILKKDVALADEAFRLERSEAQIILTASGDSGFRYGVCELEERVRNGEFGVFEETPAIPRRITRCFFAPNSRPPLKMDELKDEDDYYPEAYLDRIMHDRLNGVWLTIYLNDMPCSLFPGRGAEAPKILGKLQRVVDRCAEYGIKCYLYMAEPRIFADSRWKSGSLDDLKRHPDLAGHQSGKTYQFCTSTAKGKHYLEETVGHIFSTVHGLGGVINIMCQESAHPCALWKLYPHSQMCNCPRCSKRSAGELFGEIASVMSGAIKKYQPDAEFFGWFYASFHKPGEPENDIRFEIADHWPRTASMIHNLETGGVNRQLGRDHHVQDYSLSWAGPSDYFFELASHLPHLAAKMQTGCSHEDASVPYLPVPGILFERYRNLRRVNCNAVMQCWYFGSFPGLMNRAAGRLSFNPFPQDMETFLTELAKPEWGANAAAAGKAWRLFSEGYRNFPENLPFKWCGPLHNSIVCPWYLYPADKPVTPSYTQAFPKNSGDRFGEYFNFEHTPEEIGILTKRMEEPWLEGVKLIKAAAKTPAQQRQARLAEAIGIQFSSTRRLFDFYRMREEMIWRRIDHKAEMKELIAEEIAGTLRMAELCKMDSTLGYHSEVESYLFFPEKLYARAELLRSCAADFETFDLDEPELKRYRGEGEKFFQLLPETEAKPFDLGGTSCRVFRKDNKIVMEFKHFAAPVTVEFEPARMMHIIGFDITAEKHGHDADFVPGIAFFHGKDEAHVEFDLEVFRAWRVLPAMPYRFNLSCGKAALVPRKPWQGRLCQGDFSAEELMFLHE